MKVIDQIANSGTVILVTDNPISEVANHVVLVNNSAITTATASPPTPYYNVIPDTTVPGRALIKIFNLVTGTCYLFSTTVYTNPNVEFWSDDFDAAALDKNYQGGTWSSGIVMDALGVNPEDLIIDGDSFMSPSVSYAPEELLPGHTVDSLGINVYTKGPDSYATVISSNFGVLSGQTTTVVLSAFPDAYSGIRVVFNDRVLERSTTTVGLTTSQFFIDGRYLTIPPQPVSGNGGYTFVRIGGTGLVDYNSTDVPKYNTTNTAIVDSLISYDDAEYVYVQLNGREMTSTIGTTYYELKPNFDNNNRASVYVYGLNTSTDNTIEAWFFNTPFVTFNKMNEQIFTIAAPTSSLTLQYPPGDWEPFSDKAIVEVSNSISSTDRKRLIPPYVSNYVKINNQLTYFIDNRYDNRTLPYLTGITPSNIFVYVNGTMIRRGYDYTIDLVNFTISLVPNLYPDGVYVSITTDKVGVGNQFDYIISGNNLLFYNSSGPSTRTNTNLKITTFKDHDDLFINNEVFPINVVGLYQLEYPAVDENYVWVYLDGTPLIHRNDFEIFADGKTLRLSEDVTYTSSSTLMVTSIKNPANFNKVYGYRIFKDFRERDSFKRLSRENTTFLTENLKFYDTKIKVFDSAVLSPVNLNRNIPGVVLVDRERIEFFNQDFDQLQDLRRGTLGTSAAFYIDEGTKVIDQGINQTLPYHECTFYYSTLTSTASTYTIPFYKNEVTVNSLPYVNSTAGITLNTSTIISPTDQVYVYFGGYQLKKASYQKYYEKLNDEITIPAEFDVDVLSTSLSIVSTLTSATVVLQNLLPNEVFKVSLNLTTSSNTTTFWSTASTVYSSTITTSGVIGTSGVIYSTFYSSSGTVFAIDNLYGLGITSTVTITLLYQHLTLNIRDRLVPGVHLYLTKKEGYVWTQNQSLLESNDANAAFIRQKEAELPDVYYYGGDPRLLDSNNVPLTDDNGTTLTRY